MYLKKTIYFKNQINPINLLIANTKLDIQNNII